MSESAAAAGYGKWLLGGMVVLGAAGLTAVYALRDPPAPAPAPGAPPAPAPAPPAAPKPAVPPAAGTQTAPALDLGNGLAIELIPIQPGTFMMGSDKGEPDERPIHKVTISRDYLIGKYEVTQEQWEAVMGSMPAGFKGPRRPIESVTWEEAVAFTKALSLRTGRTARLPTEAEWEYACRAGTTTEYVFGDSVEQLPQHGWFSGNSGLVTHDVGGKPPNPWGLYDVHGNVWEWCLDWFDVGYYANSPAIDPRGPESGTHRALRGGGYVGRDRILRSADRAGHRPTEKYKDLGLRVLVEVEAPPKGS
jgi:formylglycine-generating enzyme required for sulfatase activity